MTKLTTGKTTTGKVNDVFYLNQIDLTGRYLLMKRSRPRMGGSGHAIQDVWLAGGFINRYRYINKIVFY